MAEGDPPLAHMHPMRVYICIYSYTSPTFLRRFSWFQAVLPQLWKNLRNIQPTFLILLPPAWKKTRLIARVQRHYYAYVQSIYSIKVFLYMYVCVYITNDIHIIAFVSVIIASICQERHRSTWICSLRRWFTSLARTRWSQCGRIEEWPRRDSDDVHGWWW